MNNLRKIFDATARQCVRPTGLLSSQFTSNSQSKNCSTVMEWQNAVSAAEKLVGYPTSYLTLRSLLSDEISNVAVHLRKLVATSHPLMDTAKQLLKDGGHGLQTRGLLVLLLSKAVGRADDAVLNFPGDSVCGVLLCQRSLAEITEMIHTAQLIHKGIVDVQGEFVTSGAAASDNEYEFGNKIAILCGDYMLANACKALATLQNPQVVSLVSSSISDFTKSEFLSMLDDDANGFLNENYSLDKWWEKTYLSVGSLLAKSCQSTLLLAGHRDAALLELAFSFGKQLAFAWQGHSDLQPFMDFMRSRNYKHSNILEEGVISGLETEEFMAKRVDMTTSRNLFDVEKLAAGLQEEHFKGNKSINSSFPTASKINPILDGQCLKVKLTSLPVVQHVQYLSRNAVTEDNSRAVEEFWTKIKAMRKGNLLPDEVVLNEICAGEADGLRGAVNVVHEHSQKAISLLQELPNSEARTALENIARSLQNF